MSRLTRRGLSICAPALLSSAFALIGLAHAQATPDPEHEATHSAHVDRIVVGSEARAATPVPAMDHTAMQGGAPPPDARDPHGYSGGHGFTMGAARPVLADHHRFGAVLVENLEVARSGGNAVGAYDIEAWLGSSYERIALEAEGELEDGALHAERTELLWGHAFAPYWDTRLGVRHDRGDGSGRSWVGAGIAGLAPYWFDISLMAYLGEQSRSAVRFDASYEMLLTQRVVFEPSLEANFYGKPDPERGVGSGLSSVSLGLRLRYELRRELAPYIGIERITDYGETKNLSRAAGRDPSDWRVVAGLRFWF